jgi:hypothetical protein
MLEIFCFLLKCEYKNLQYPFILANEPITAQAKVLEKASMYSQGLFLANPHLGGAAMLLS